MKLCPEFLKFKPPRLKQYNHIHELYEVVVRNSLEEAKQELTLSISKLQLTRDIINKKMGPNEMDKLEDVND